MNLKFQDLLDQATAIKESINDLNTVTYTIYPEELEIDGAPVTYYFLCYFDMDSMSMRFTLTDSALVEVKLLDNLNPALMIAYGKFIERITSWQKGEIEDYPYSAHSGVMPDNFTQNVTADDDHIDGDEGKLE